MNRYEELEQRVDRLEEIVNRLAGNPPGPIGMREARLALERGDKAMVRRYLRQFREGGDAGKVSALCGAAAVNQNPNG